MKDFYKRKIGKIVILLFILSLAITLIFSISAFAKTSITNSNNVNEVVDKYIMCMKNQDYETILDMITTKDVGHDAKIYNYEKINKYSHEPDALKQFSSANLKDIIKSQYEFVKEKFADNSWDNVTYKVVKTNCPSKKEEFVDIKTKQKIPESEAITISDNYWENFAKERGIEYQDFLNIKEQNGIFNKDENMNILIAKELGYQPPIQVNLIDEYDYYEIYFSFNGKNCTDKGESEFKISIDNKNGSFRINDGLRWSVPLSEENMKDI